MKHRIIETESYGHVQQHVIIERKDGSFESFPVDEDNPRYQQWISEGNVPQIMDEV